MACSRLREHASFFLEHPGTPGRKRGHATLVFGHLSFVLHFLKKLPVILSLHQGTRWSTEFRVAQQFAYSNRKLVPDGLCPQQLTSLWVTIGSAANALPVSIIGHSSPANDANTRIARFNLRRMGIFSESAVEVKCVPLLATGKQCWLHSRFALLLAKQWHTEFPDTLN